MPTGSVSPSRSAIRLPSSSGRVLACARGCMLAGRLPHGCDILSSPQATSTFHLRLPNSVVVASSSTTPIGDIRRFAANSIEVKRFLASWQFRGKAIDSP